MKVLKRHGIVLSALLTLAATTMPASAQSGADAAKNYPNRPIRMIVGFAPGGGTDAIARVVAQELGTRLGQSVVVDNRPGANMIIGSDVVAKAAPDGYTIGVTATPTVTNPSLYSKLPFDTSKDFTWITQLTTSSLVLIANPKVPVKTVQDVIALAKKEPGKLTYGSSGSGGSLHLAGVLFDKIAGVRMTHVPYKGAGPALQDLLGGQIDFIFADIPSVLQLIKDGKVRAIGVTGPKRAPALPDVPSIADEGLNGYDVAVWYGVNGPAGMPKAIVDKLAKELDATLKSPTVTKQLSAWGVTPVGGTPEQSAAFIKSETAKWADTIKSANIHLD
jgi:tripartite-type tricarboxylate transporter receptor subunit TctC